MYDTSIDEIFAAFDLIVIDEVDAFPFESSAILHYAMTQALKPLGQKNIINRNAKPSVTNPS
ncbi:hypothetical protein [Holzapfeliella floricola]|uniref:hypothetical protein n=1 Tax=Holzapfeliella floricola TaxID=679249 RepID=UPI001A92553F|nr:hypothetical protein [Holzapfeliella floricola]